MDKTDRYLLTCALFAAAMLTLAGWLACCSPCDWWDDSPDRCLRQQRLEEILDGGH